MWISKRKYNSTMELLKSLKEYKEKYADVIKEDINNNIKKELDKKMKSLLNNFEIIEIKKGTGAYIYGYVPTYGAILTLKSKTKIKSIVTKEIYYDYDDVMEWVREREMEE